MWRKVILNSLYFSGLQKALKPHVGGIGSILMLHRVQNIKREAFSPNYHLSASPEFLDRAIFKLKMQGYDFISMDEVAERLENPDKYIGANPFLSITLDDGYRDNLKNAVPVFQRHNVPYMIYVAPLMVEAKSPIWWEDLELIISTQKKIIIDMPSGKQEHDISTIEKKSSVYNMLVKSLLFDTDQYLQREIVGKLCRAYGFECQQHVKDNIMNWNELSSLAKDPLCSLGAHTMNHYALSKLTKEDARNEILESRDVIKNKLNIHTNHLAYPYGLKQVAGKREFDIANELGFLSATTTRHGVIYPEHKDHITALPRVSLNGNHQSMRYVTTLLSGVPTRIKNHGKKLDII